MSQLKKKRGNKKQRRQWWDSLTPERRAECLEYWKQEKADNRREKEKRRMKRLGISHDCSLCIHRASRSCVDYMPDGCRHYYNPDDEHHWNTSIEITEVRGGLKARVA